MGITEPHVDCIMESRVARFGIVFRLVRVLDAFGQGRMPMTRAEEIAREKIPADGTMNMSEAREILAAALESYASEKAKEERLNRALSLMIEAHQGQVDKIGQPYMFHPLRVMGIVASSGSDVNDRIAALLHDVVEDTAVALPQIRERFGAEVAESVDALTRRKQQGETYMQFIDRVLTNPRAVRVKIADIQDNSDPARQWKDQAGLIERRYKPALARLLPLASERAGWGQG